MTFPPIDSVGEDELAGSQPRRSITGFYAVMVALTVALAACQPGPPPPPPTLVPTSPPGTTAPPATSPPETSPPAPSPPGPPPSDSVRFTAQGDIGLGSNARKVLDVIAGIKPDLNLALGDLSYESGREREFCDMVTGKLGADFPYQLLTGNHESNGRDGRIENFVRCLPNRLTGLEGEYGKQWRVDVPADKPVVRFIMVSPGLEFPEGAADYSPGSERWRWTEAAIDEARSRNIPWTVVGMHAPCLSVGKYDCVAGQEFTNMLIEKKVDLVLSGHDHVYQRTHQISVGSQCPRLVPASFSQGCLSGRDGSMVKGRGTVFATVGVGGVGFYDIHDNDPESGYFAAAIGRNHDATFGTLDVTATGRELAARFVPAAGYSFTDSFTVQRR